jgi:hypothetical protein
MIDRINAALTLAELDEIDKELEAMGLDARKWRFAVAKRRMALKGKVMTPAPATQPATGDLGPANAMPAFASTYGLPAPDGRRLHAYRLSADNFEALQRALKQQRTYKALESGYTPGLFVLWASEWFRRSYQGGMRTWESLTDTLGLPKPGQSEQAILRDITGSGLRQWGRPVFSDSSNQYLATLAREGGFPACAVAGGAQGWARTILEAIVQRLLGTPSAGETEALALASDQAGNLPGVFNDDEFIQLCADLALAIVKVRRDFELAASSAGIPLASWLKLNQPDWQEELPISTGEADADRLIESLIEVEVIKGSSVSVERFLQRDPSSGHWQEAVRLALDGEIAATNMSSVDTSHGRLRAFAAGAMARYFPGELALFDPPAVDARTWSARSSRDARNMRPLPFHCAVQIDLRAGSRLIAQVELPGGKPRRGQLLVCVLEEGTADTPNALRVIGSGSGSFWQPELFLQAPDNWAVRPTDDGSVEDLGTGVGATKMWRVQGGARLVDPTNDIFKILCGQTKDQSARIILTGDHPGWATVDGDVDLFVGAPHVSKNGQGELMLRQLERGSSWRPMPAGLPVGHYELGLRQDGIMIDRRRVAVLPARASIRTVITNKGAEFEVTGFDGVTISPGDDAPVQASPRGNYWQAKPQAELAYCFKARIEWTGAPHLWVTIAYPGKASIATWGGRILPDRSILTIDDLADLVAVDRGDMVLLARLRDPMRQVRSEMSWSFSREMPMSAIASDIAGMLLPASIDAEVILEMNDGINTNWHVRHFPMALKKEGSGFVTDKAIVDNEVRLCGRTFVDPVKEEDFGPYSLLSDRNHRPISVPEDLSGHWLIYLRRRSRVLTRPLYVKAGPSSKVPVGALAAAMATPLGNPQERALKDFLALAAVEEPTSTHALTELLKLVEGLRGLPPGTFNVLTKLPDFPEVLTRMAFFAQPDQRDAVMDLSLALPFAWFAIEKRHWIAAEQAFELASMHIFKELGDDAPRFAKQRIDMAKKAIVDHQPLLAAVLSRIKTVPLEEATQTFMRHATEQIQPTNGTRYRSRLGTALPAYFQRFDQSYFDTLDAPCAAALAVKGAWMPTLDDIHHMKLIARTFPTWFAEAFAIWLG